MLIEAERAKSRIEELLEKSTRLFNKVWLSDIQIKLLQVAAQKGVAKANDFLQVSGLSEKGTYQSLQKLVQAKLLKKTEEKKGTIYTIPEEGLEYVR